jgi:hypothetical protein
MISRHALKKQYGDVDTVIGEDESGVGGCELGSRHGDVVRGRCRDCGLVRLFAMW